VGGLRNHRQVIILFLFAFFPMVINTYKGVKSGDAKLLEVGRAFRGRAALWANIVCPARGRSCHRHSPCAWPRAMIGMVWPISHAISGIVI